MPVESRDDLVKRLRDIVTGPDHVIREAATRIEADAKRIAELEAESDHHLKCWKDVLMKWNGAAARAITAERALAEERERCAQAVYGSVAMVPMGQVDASEFLDFIEDAIATAIRSGKPDGKKKETQS